MKDSRKVASWTVKNNGLPYFYQCKECALIVKSHLKEEHKCYGSPKKEWFFKTKSFIQKMNRYCKYKLKLFKDKE